MKHYSLCFSACLQDSASFISPPCVLLRTSRATLLNVHQLAVPLWSLPRQPKTENKYNADCDDRPDRSKFPVAIVIRNHVVIAVPAASSAVFLYE